MRQSPSLGGRIDADWGGVWGGGVLSTVTRVLGECLELPAGSEAEPRSETHFGVF